MTCTIKTRASVPELLLALREAEQDARSIEDSMCWARSNGHGVLAEAIGVLRTALELASRPQEATR